MPIQRAVHLVGSVPADDAESAMRMAIEAAGPRLRSLPDGETGARRDWIVHIINDLASHPDLELTKPGDWSSYDNAARVRVRRGHRLTADSLDFGHLAAFESASPIVGKLNDEYGIDATPQVGLPGDLDLAMFAFGPIGALRHRRVFAEALVRQIRHIHEFSGGQAVFQIEIPAELVFLTRAPRPLRPQLARVLVRGIAALVRQAPAGTRFGIHLCVGDLGNQALGRLSDSRPLVQLTNALVRAWPAGQALEFVHAPFAAGTHPAPADANFYRPLNGLKLPDSIRFIAGFVHESASMTQLQQTLSAIEAAAGRRVDIATACGLGRRSPQTADDLLRTCARLADG